MTSQTPADKRIRISIILPVYNVAGFLPECLQSIIDQSFDHEIEALLIDDCSTDDSKLICENFVREYATIFKLFTHEKNSGVSVARNTGLDNALGDYFMFVDPDDVLPTGALQSLYIAATQYNADIVKGNNTIFNELGEHNARFDVASEAMITGDDVLTTLYDHTRVRGHPWGKIFNRNRFGHIRFPVAMRIGEDVYYCAQLFSEAKSLLLIAKPVYRYRKMATGLSSRKLETGTYLTMIDSVEKLGAFARTPHQARTHKGLQLRTLAEIARECRKIDTAIATVALSVIEQKCVQWNIRLPDLLRDKLPLRDLARYAKLQRALCQIRRNLAQSS